MPLIRSPVKPTSPKMADRMQIVSEFTGQFKHMSRYSSGCTILEKLLDHAPDDVVTLVFDELKDSLPELILHPNGQHILPKIAEFGSEETKDELFEVFSLDLVRYCCHQFGGYASQKVAPFMKSRHIKQWTPTLKKNMSTLATDPHGNYVVQLLLKIFNADETSFFFDGLVNSASSVAQTKIGCSVLTHAMDLTTKEQLNKIIPNLMVNCSELIQDQYGNFVIQRLMDNYPDILTDVISCITGNVVYYSKQKFSSNVVEKCLKSGSKAQVSVLLNELYESESISVLIEDQYGNFVIQASLDCVPENEKESVASKILPHIPKNGKFSYHIERSCCKHYLNKYFIYFYYNVFVNLLSLQPFLK
ncbi:PUM-HD domain-containing protein [Entamoeba marina]